MSDPSFNLGKWHVCKTNFSGDVQSDFDYPRSKRVFINDFSLRKLDLIPGGPLLPTETFLELAANLDTLGVAQIVLSLYGARFPKEKNLQLIKAVGEQAFRSRLTVEVRTRLESWKEDIDQCIDAGAKKLVFTLVPPVSFHSEDQGRCNPAEVSRLHDAIQRATDRGAETRLVILDASRVGLNYVVELFNEFIEQQKISELAYMDSVSCITPEAMKYVIKKIRSGLRKEVPVGVHVHNDFGLASATTIAAVTGGATYIDVSVNGIGDKGGFASLGETVTALEILYGINTGIKLEKLAETSRLFEDKTGVPSEPYSSFTGKNAFTYDAEERVAAVLENKPQSLSRAVNPEIVGQESKVVWAMPTLAGSALKSKLTKMSLKYTESELDEIIEIVKGRLQKLEKYPVWVTDSDFEEICKHVIKEK